MAKKQVKATKLSVSLPFGLGQLEFEPDEAQQRAAWELYVELTTRIAVQPLNPDEGILSEALTSLHEIFVVTRDILRRAGPLVAKGPSSFGAVAIEVLNQGIRPFLTKWHPLLLAYEQKRPPEVPVRDYEQAWENAQVFRQELSEFQKQMVIYVDALAKIAGVAK